MESVSDLTLSAAPLAARSRLQSEGAEVSRCTREERSERYASLDMYLAPNRSRWWVWSWQSMSENPHRSSAPTRVTKAHLEASGRRVNMDSPKKTWPRVTP